MAKKYYVTFTDEIDGLAEGSSDIDTGDYTEKQAEREARAYMDECPDLTGVIATFHDRKAYDQARKEYHDFAPTETHSILWGRV